MSWSISLSGSREMVQSELDSAFGVIREALNRVTSSKADSISVSLSGWASKSIADDGAANNSVSACFTIHGTVDALQPPASTEDAPATSE